MRNRLISLALLTTTLIATPLGAQTKVTARIPDVQDAPIAYLLDTSSGQVLYERDIDRRFMPASITKVMTTFLAFEWMEEGRLFPQQVYGVRPDTFRKWNRKGSTMFLPADARVTVDDLLHGITTVSANDGAVVLAEGAAGSVEDWVAAMNSRAHAIGMSNSHFGTPNGWMDGGKTFVTARDLGTLAQAMVTRHPSKYRHFVGATGLKYNGIEQRNHDPISGVVEGADGIKTGFTNQAGYGFLGSAKRNGQRLVMVVAASPTGRGRNKAAREFIESSEDDIERIRAIHAALEATSPNPPEWLTRSHGTVATSPLRADIASHRRIVAQRWYWRGVLEPTMRLSHWREAISRFKSAECPAAAAELLLRLTRSL